MSVEFRMDTNRRTGEPVCLRCGGDHMASLFSDMSAQHRLMYALIQEAERRVNEPARHSAERERWLTVCHGLRDLEGDLIPLRGDCQPRFAGSPYTREGEHGG